MVVHPLRTMWAIGGLALYVTIAASGDARAFTETQAPPAAVAPADAKQEKPAAPLQLQKPDQGNGLALTTPSDAESGGTEVKIPGIGTVGVLPKLDFGLELLYGAAGDEKQPSDKSIENKTDEDMLIKGTIKHRF